LAVWAAACARCEWKARVNLKPWWDMFLWNNQANRVRLLAVPSVGQSRTPGRTDTKDPAPTERETKVWATPRLKEEDP